MSSLAPGQYSVRSEPLDLSSKLDTTSETLIGIRNLFLADPSLHAVMLPLTEAFGIFRLSAGKFYKLSEFRMPE